MNIKLIWEVLLLVCSMLDLNGASIVKRQIFGEPAEFGEDPGEPREFGEGGRHFRSGLWTNPSTATNTATSGIQSARTNIRPRSRGEYRWRYWKNLARTIAGILPAERNPTAPRWPINLGVTNQQRHVAQTNPGFPAAPVIPENQQRGNWGELGETFRRRSWINRGGVPSPPPAPVQTYPNEPANQNPLAIFQAQIAAGSAPIVSGSAPVMSGSSIGHVQLAALTAPDPPVVKTSEASVAQGSSVLVVM